jgi:hypothetical protein
MDLENFKAKLRQYKEGDIIINRHAREQAEVRQISFDEIKRNIMNPDRLVFVEEQEAKRKSEKKHNCYFAYSDNYYHRYIIVLDGKLIIVTVISINRNWQRAVEGRK